MPMGGTTRIQKTVRVPIPLLKEVERYIHICVKEESINDFIVKAMKLRLHMLRRRHIDAQFSGMSKDVDYQEEARLITGEFEASDWETIRDLGE